VKLIRFLCDRFHLVAGQLQSPHYGIEITDEYDVQDLLDSLSQLRSDTDAVVAKVIDAMRQKLGNQIINNQKIMITGGNVTMSNNQNYVETMSERKININQSGASIGVGYSENVEANQLGGTINNYPSEQKQTLAEAAAEIQQLLQQLEQTYPTNTTTGQMVVATKVIERIESDQIWKQRVVNAVKEGGLQAFEKAIDNPVGAFIVGAIKGWQEAEIE
jgi:deoxycytidylate deaminase